MGKFCVRYIRTLAFEYEIRLLEVIVAVDNEVRVVVWRAPRNIDLKANALRRIFVLIDQLRPEFRPDLLLWIGRLVRAPLTTKLSRAFARSRPSMGARIFW